MCQAFIYQPFSNQLSQFALYMKFYKTQHLIHRVNLLNDMLTTASQPGPPGPLLEVTVSYPMGAPPLARPFCLSEVIIYGITCQLQLGNAPHTVSLKLNSRAGWSRTRPLPTTSCAGYTEYVYCVYNIMEYNMYCVPKGIECNICDVYIRVQQTLCTYFYNLNLQLLVTILIIH